MSHHLDRPLARQDVRLDITDLMSSEGETGTVFVMNVCHSIAGDIPVPGYHPEGMYEFKIDLDGDAVEDLTYRVTFSERDPAGKQRFTLRRIAGADAADPHAAGTILAEGVTGEAATTENGRAHLGRQGRRSVLDRAGRAARCRPRIPGRDAKWIYRGGMPQRQKTCLRDARFIPSCWKSPTLNCSRKRTATGASACGLCLRWRPTRAAGARSTASAFR